MIRLNLFLIIAVVLLSSCNSIIDDQVVGNGKVESSEHQFSQFTEVSTSGAFDVYLSQDSTFNVKIEAESNIIPFIELSISGDQLRLDVRENTSFRLTYPIKIYIGHDGLSTLSVEGSGLVDLDEIKTDEFSLSMSGTGDVQGDLDAKKVWIEITGSGDFEGDVYCTDFNYILEGTGDCDVEGTAYKGVFEIEGTGSVNASNFELTNCYATIAGTGNMFLNVSKYLNAEISGTGSIKVKGTPTVDQKISGTGSVIFVN